jgi:CheY-like chemotaxis protein
LIKEAAHKKNLKVISTFDIMVNKLRADERRLKQILVNLLSNAIKFTPEGGSIGLEVVGDPAHDMVQFTVWDTGIGIAPENMDRLFLPFVQLDSSLARAYEGTGLGLTMVNRLAELHAGNVQVESRINQGSRFIVSIPRLGPNADPALDASVFEAEVALTELNEASPLREIIVDDKPTILVAEDNRMTVEMLLDYLPNQGYHMLVAGNGDQAVEMARQHQPNLILMDIQMSGSDGLAAIRQIRGDAELRNIPIIALTALVMPGDRERCLEAGADEYLSKPVSLRKLTEAIETRLEDADG